MAELPDNTGSDASIESRLTSFFGGGDASSADAAPEVAPDDEPEQQTEASADDDQPEAADESSDEIEEEVEGVKLRGRKEDVERIKSERASKADYTRRTQEAANLAKAAEDRIQFAQAQQQIVGALVADYAKVEAKRERLNQLQTLDISQLDPSQALGIMRQIDQLRSSVQEDEKTLGNKASQLQAAQQAHAQKQWELAVEGAKARIGSFTSAEDVAMLNQVKSLGFNENELRGRFADPRFLQLVYKAAKYDAIASNKATSLKSLQKAPPVVKPGAVVPGAAAERSLNDARARLKKTGRVEDAAALFMRLK